MTFDRAPWQGKFTATSTLPWNCPGCEGGRLAIVDGSLQTGQTTESVEAQQHPASEPEWIEGRFVCLFGCRHCGGEIAVAGTYRFQDDRYLDEVMGEQGDYEKYFRPLFFSEPPRMIAIPEATPDEVKDELLASFRLYWVDPDSTANKIRSSVERLLTAQRVNRTTGRKRTKGSRKFLTLDHRIKRFAEKKPDLADHLLAVKWLGNVGSHSGSISQDDLLDSYEIIEYVLAELYLTRSKRVGAISRAINRRKGPRSRRRPRAK